MRALYIYNPYVTKEIEVLERARQETGYVITTVSIEHVPQMLKDLISATPCLIIISDDLQGNQLTGDSVDGKLLSSAIIQKRLDEEHAAVYGGESMRLDTMIKSETNKAIDQYTYDLLIGGIL